MKQETALKNREVYQRDPSTRKLENEGVANVNDGTTAKALTVLRYELETFVCEGQYKSGMEDILDTYLKNIGREKAEQRAVWVSGFFGSGKSHLVKMLRALWMDTKFDDGATARAIANIPESIKESLKELSIQSKKHGGLHAASGTLGASASGSVRLALLSIVFKSVGLPEKYPVARFVMWLKSEGVYEQVRAEVENNGNDWHEELDNFYVAEGLHVALVKCKPNLFSSEATCTERLHNQYPNVEDVSNDEMLKAIKLALSKDGKLPLTLIVLDEVQQYIGGDRQRSNSVQETVEACCKNVGGNLLFIGTGQTGITGEDNLKKLEGRFTVRIELSDTDVDAVVRKVILAKKPDAIVPIEEEMKANIGEISRHLNGTKIEHKKEDVVYFAQDYPLLPVRRRFWETALKALDQTGTESQLRNQLSMVHKAIQSNLDTKIGNVIPADYLFFESADKLLQARVLPRKVHEKIMLWSKGNSDEKLKARAAALVFLVNKVASANKEIGIKATVDTIADLLVTDLKSGSSELRSRLPELLDKRDLLIKVNNEYRIETEESAAWNDEFQKQRGVLGNFLHLIEELRDKSIQLRISESLKKTVQHGNEKRDLVPCFSKDLPADSESRLIIWIRDGWHTDENSVKADARQAGNQSPTIFVFIPQRNTDALRNYLMDFKAASETLFSKSASDTSEGKEARLAIETIKSTAENKIRELIDECIANARVFQAGGSEIVGNNLQDMIFESTNNSLQRLYPDFSIADNPAWKKVYELAKSGAPDALKAIQFDGEPSTNPVCKKMLGYIGSGKKGIDIRSHFEGAGFGWSGDTIDGALHVLLVAGLARTQDEHGKPALSTEIDRKSLGKLNFKVESASVSTNQRIQIRKLFQKAGCQCKQGEELSSVPEFIQIMKDLASKAGGEAPKPFVPKTDLLEEIRLSVGNEQLLLMLNRLDELIASIDNWKSLVEKIEPRWTLWLELQDLLDQAGSLSEAQEARIQCDALREQRLLIIDPDPVLPLLKSVENALRKELVASYKRYDSEIEQKMAQLNNDASWCELSDEEQAVIKEQCDLKKKQEPSIEDGKSLVLVLKQNPLSVWNDRIDAISRRCDKAREIAVTLRAPKAQTVDLPKRTLKTSTDVDNWIAEVKKKLEAAVKEGPVIIR